MATLAKPDTQGWRVPVVVGFDFSEASELALQQAFAMVNASPGAEPHVVCVTAAYGPMVRIDMPDDVKTLAIDEASELLRRHIEGRVTEFRRERPTFFERVVTHVRVGTPAEQIVQLAADLDADLVIVGSDEHRGVRRLLSASVTEAVTRAARCPVLVVRPKQHDELDSLPAPPIEPPCPMCVQARLASNGEQMWCAQHSERHGSRPTYHYVGRNVSSQENIPLIRPF